MDRPVNVPSWLQSKLFEPVLRASVGDFKEIRNFKVTNALAPGENYATLMLRVELEVLLVDDSLHIQKFMLKLPQDNKMYREHLCKWDMFKKESGMYREVIPEMEELYRNKGLDVRFGAKAYTLAVQEEYILLEDLSPMGFRNAKRQEGLDLVHTKSVLKKLAQWHAASAVRVAEKGRYPELYVNGFLTETGRSMSEKMMAGNSEYILKATRKLPNHKDYYENLEAILPCLTDVLFAQAKLDPNVFNVLNHGDFWCNNIMFQYNEDDVSLRDTYFVDLQMPSYGTPAQDLLYFIISSTQLDLKVACFDQLIRFYYDHLTDHLKLLEYPAALPHLGDIHKSLIKMGAWGLMTTVSIMSGVLCEPTDMANIDNFIESSEDGKRFKEFLYFNDRYIRHLDVLLPWLYNRGAFELGEL